MFVRLFSVGLFFLVCGCVANNGLGSLARSEININNLSRLSTGMKQCEVLQVMRQPYSHETFEVNNAVYDVWFYITKPTVLGQSRMVPQNLTPLTFKNGILVGWGFAYYNYLVRKEEAPTIQPPKKVVPEKEVEDKALQRILQGTDTPKKSSSPNQTKPAAPKDAAKPKSTPKAPPVDEKSPTKPAPPEPAKPLQSIDSGKIETLKTTPLEKDKMEKPEKNAPEKLRPPELNIPQKKTTSLKDSMSHSVSMSSSPKKPAPKAAPPQKPQKPLLDEKDQDMLEDAADQNFNQT